MRHDTKAIIFIGDAWADACAQLMGRPPSRPRRPALLLRAGACGLMDHCPRYPRGQRHRAHGDPLIRQITAVAAFEPEVSASTCAPATWPSAATSPRSRAARLTAAPGASKRAPTGSQRPSGQIPTIEDVQVIFRPSSSIVWPRARGPGLRTDRRVNPHDPARTTSTASTARATDPRLQPDRPHVNASWPAPMRSSTTIRSISSATAGLHSRQHCPPRGAGVWNAAAERALWPERR